MQKFNKDYKVVSFLQIEFETIVAASTYERVNERPIAEKAGRTGPWIIAE